MIPDLPANIEQIKGFLAADEGAALYRHAQAARALGPVLEVGSYCGKSTLYLGLACRDGGTVYALDHHRGSEEHQAGEMFHDPDLYDSGEALVDTFREFRRNIRTAGLDDTVVPLVSSSDVVARHWRTPLGMVFIDGGHSLDAALLDYRCWSCHLVQGGILAVHDLFPDPYEGGQAPWAIYQMALASGLFAEVERVNTLGILRRL
ncbi:class I SAM-dependent methyltransferase [Parahaliea aestuarii]|uniref:Class I SAM-dependent methyltransferase n=1 Tax=Parahaliea aestuarii TaxID=1852021 RepID=A0A5C8ZV93_9GAMM|nr:class I SAM-dependent methyltransferase [Parahaliea aestuarii]TXS92443.1 class I SAM-dependent methyltransferase [Parahaliea aestuarii]